MLTVRSRRSGFISASEVFGRKMKSYSRQRSSSRSVGSSPQNATFAPGNAVIRYVAE